MFNPAADGTVIIELSFPSKGTLGSSDQITFIAFNDITFSLKMYLIFLASGSLNVLFSFEILTYDGSNRFAIPNEIRNGMFFSMQFLEIKTFPLTSSIASITKSIF